MKEKLEQFKLEAKKLQSELDACVLDGTPYLVTLKHDNALLIYGELYPDQLKNAEQNKKGFRFQRRFDLCGCHLFTHANASKLVSQFNDTRETPGRVEVLHRREWFTQELESLNRVIALLEAALEKLSA